MSTPGYTEKIKEERTHDIWLENLSYERISCVKCSKEMGYFHDPSGGEYGFDHLCNKCAKIIHYEKMGMFE